MPNFTAQALFDMVATRHCSVTIGKISSESPVTFRECLGDFPLVAIAEILDHGFQRKFNDHSPGAPIEDKQKATRAMIDRFKKGDCGRVNATEREPLDPVREIARGLAKKHLRKDAAKWNEFVTAAKKEADASNGKIKIGALLVKEFDRVIADKPILMEKAKMIHEIESETVSGIDLNM